MANEDMLNSFSTGARALIKSVSNTEASDIDSLIRVQGAVDKSNVTRQLLASWSIQQQEERRLRKIYSISFIAILAVQIVILNLLFFLIGIKTLIFTEVQINVFFVSVFAEIVSLVLIVTKYLFPRKNQEKVLEILKDL